MAISYQDLVTQASTNLGPTGLATNPTAINQVPQNTIAQPDYSSLVSTAYQNILGRAPESAGLDYWSGQLSSGALTPESLYENIFLSAQGSDQVNAQKYAQNLAATNVTKLYEDILGRAPDTAGLNYWAQTFGPTISDEERLFFQKAAAPELVSKSYQTVFGREAEQAGLDYWTNEIQSNRLGFEDLEKIIARGAQESDRIAAQRYLGEEVWAPEEYLKGTGYQGYQDIVNYINANTKDPVRVAQMAAQYGIDPEEILAAKQAVGGQDVPTLEAIQDYLNQGRAGFGERYGNIYSSTFGSAEEQAATERALGLPEGSLQQVFAQEQFANKSIEDIESELQGSSVNKTQEALRLASVIGNMYGYDPETTQKLATDLYSGKVEDKDLVGIYEQLLQSNTLSPELQKNLLAKVAVENPNAKVFQDNPDLLTVYKPISPTKGTTGQYGYVNNAPVLNAAEADRLLGGNAFKKIDTVENNELGWMTNSRYVGAIRKGAALFGVETPTSDIKNFGDIEKSFTSSGGYREYYDPEQGLVRQAIDIQPFFNSVYGAPDPENGGLGPTKFLEYQDTKAKLQKAATQLGIDPNQPIDKLFDAVSNDPRVADKYVVSGRTRNWDPEAAANAGIKTYTGERGDMNHANVVYQRVGDKLVPVQAPQVFTFNDPKSKSFIQSLASVPFVAELAMLLPGVGQAAYPFLKAGQAALQGADFGDIAKSAGLAYLGQNVLPDVTSGFAGDIAGGLEGLLSPELAKQLATIGASGAVSGGITSLMGGNFGEGFMGGALGAGVNQFAPLLKDTPIGDLVSQFPKQYQPIVFNALIDAVISGDPEQALQKALSKVASSEAKNLLKTQPTTG